MDEKRIDKRIPIGMSLSISDLYKDGVDAIVDLESSIQVTDISSHGIGFISKCILPIGYYFIADIEVSNNLPQIITDVRIVRSSAIDRENYHYGAQFVSVSPSVKKMLQTFEEDTAV
ncbi:MAG: PilZ domain-containing protein [Lachnospiraceae bacterium]|nr:PilZ domain-containing protein [Lachnospiraceae bacterium]